VVLYIATIGHADRAVILNRFAENKLLRSVVGLDGDAALSGFLFRSLEHRAVVFDHKPRADAAIDGEARL
jgi:hypothetical protein